MGESSRSSCLVLAGVVAASLLSVFVPGRLWATSPTPEGVEWHLLEVGGAPVSVPAGERKPELMLDPEEGTATGFGGCNGFFASYRLDGESLSFGPVAATRRFCQEGGAVEAALMVALAKTSGWRISSGELLLLAGDEVVARFAPKQEHGGPAGWDELTVRSRALDNAEVTLREGVYEGPPAAPDAASRVTVRLTDRRAFGWMNGGDAAAVVLATSLGGSGTFSELALLCREGERWLNVDTVDLGDRVAVQSIAVEDDGITVSMLNHGPSDPMCCPTVEQTRRFMLEDGRLVAERKAAGNEPRELEGGVWRWVRTLYNNDTTISPTRPEDYTLHFLEGGRVEAKADCNLKTGTYTRDGNRLSISIFGSTMAACAPGSPEEEFTRDLTRVQSFLFHDGDLVLALKLDTGTMRFSPEGVAAEATAR